MPDLEVDAQLQVEDGGSERQLSVEDFKAPATGDATEATLLDVLAALGATVTVDGTVSLSVATLAALEAITVTVSGAVALDGPTLAALATAAKQDALAAKVPDEEGTWGYKAGVSGTVNVPAGKRVIGIAATGGAGAAAMTIDGGDSVPIPANMGAEIAPRGNLVAPAIVFVGTAAYFVEFVG